jgi:hypothetical protein
VLRVQPLLDLLQLLPVLLRVSPATVAAVAGMLLRVSPLSRAGPLLWRMLLVATAAAAAAVVPANPGWPHEIIAFGAGDSPDTDCDDSTVIRDGSRRLLTH